MGSGEEGRGGTGKKGSKGRSGPGIVLAGTIPWNPFAQLANSTSFWQV